MSESFGDGPFPRAPLVGAAALVGAALLTVALVRVSGVGTVHTPDAAPVSTLEIRFADRADGGIDITDARDGHRVRDVAPGSNGFLRGTLRGLARERKREGIGQEQPFRLIGRADGRLTLEDPATGRRVDLESFGPTNAQVFAQLFAKPNATR